MGALPRVVREKVSRAVFARALQLHWQDLSLADRSRKYEEWMTDPEIGGALDQYLPREKIRVWIKDGPMKEFSRAQRGLGPYASLVVAGENLESRIASTVFGGEWGVVAGTSRVKPASFLVSNNTSTKRVFWGDNRELKHLIWAWLNNPSSDSAVIVIASTIAVPITPDVEQRNRRIAERLSTEIHYVAL